MNFTESFTEFSSRLAPTDLALYAGAGIVLWVLFKDKLSPVQKLVLDTINSLKNKLPSGSKVVPTELPVVEAINDKIATEKTANKDLFFNLVVSWKQTRDLAVLSGCTKAVEVADQMFPYLSPTACSENTDVK